MKFLFEVKVELVDLLIVVINVSSSTVDCSAKVEMI
jgi:hypothetical protein